MTALREHPAVSFLLSALVVVSDLAAAFLSHGSLRRHLHLVLASLLLSGPALSMWVSKYSVFANRNHYLYRMFLSSGWGWTCILCGSFVFLLSFSQRHSLALSLRHLSRLAAASAMWLGLRWLLTSLEDASGSCFEPLGMAISTCLEAVSPGQGSRLLLRDGESKTTCLRAGFQWRGAEVSQEAVLLCLCCLLLMEETAVFGQCAPRSPGTPLRLLFLLCVSLLGLWFFLLLSLLAHFPQFPSQLIGGALGCLAWRVLYLGWFSMEPSWCCPGGPASGLLSPAEEKGQAKNGNHRVHFS